MGASLWELFRSFSDMDSKDLSATMKELLGCSNKATTWLPGSKSILEVHHRSCHLNIINQHIFELNWHGLLIVVGPLFHELIHMLAKDKKKKGRKVASTRGRRKNAIISYMIILPLFHLYIRSSEEKGRPGTFGQPLEREVENEEEEKEKERRGMRFKEDKKRTT
ncbi:uncharacterized protein LOC133784057 [Humulus lupulus]|uniref:uncharacterized protein LOC133784057 n=1 Tax=Humulus lupulus TaxID=3486 RepID=UPI002B400866|nr:uncharacterized protein LOC133784057 [Humulus lupulus]